MKINQKSEVCKFVESVNKFNTYLTQDLFGGPKKIKMAWIINLHKFLTAFIIIFLMNWYHNFSDSAYLYLALHGSYGFIWILKHFAFRDKKWETKVTFGGAIFGFLLLATYWIAPFILISDLISTNKFPLSNFYSLFCISLFSFGLSIMIASDCQKNFTLRFKKGLITDGMFKHIRHPNYLGEMMIYSSFALITQHWLPWIILAYWWSMIFLINILTIELSLSRFPEWKDYRIQTGMLLPWKLFRKK